MTDKTKLTRRGLIAAVAGLGTAGLAVANDHHDGDATGEVGVGGRPGILSIGPAEQYEVPSGQTETYDAIHWASGGELELEGEIVLLNDSGNQIT